MYTRVFYVQPENVCYGILPELQIVDETDNDDSDEEEIHEITLEIDDGHVFVYLLQISLCGQSPVSKYLGKYVDENEARSLAASRTAENLKNSIYRGGWGNDVLHYCVVIGKDVIEIIDNE